MTTDRNTYTQSRTIEDKDIYKTVLDTRNFEISLFWQRSNYFLVLNSALAIGFFSQKPSPLTLLLSALGFLASLLWYFVMLGSKYWQSRWEDKLAELEKKIAPDLRAFAATRRETDDAVRRSLEAGSHGGFHAWLDKQTLRKPSVSFHMTVLAFVFMIGWVLVLAWAILQGVGEGAFAMQKPSYTVSPAAPSIAAQVSEAGVAIPSPVSAPTQQFHANPTINVQVTCPERVPSSPRPSSSPASRPACKQ